MNTFKIFLLVLLIPLTGCQSVGIFGKSAKAEDKQASKIEAIVQQQQANQTYSINQIASLSYGVNYSLDKITNNVPREVEIARGLNDRILTLSGMPSMEDITEMQKIIDNLRTNVVYGEKLLSIKDKEIQKLQNEKNDLSTQKDQELKKYMDLAQSTARLSDKNKSDLDQYHGWFGLKAVFLGLKQFATTSFWILLGIAIVFIILRFAAAANPVASAIFGVFEQVVAGVIKGIEVLFPKAIAFAGHVSKGAYDQLSGLLKKLVDNIQSLKDYQTKAGHDITLKEVLTEFDKSLDSNEKALVDKIKKEMGY